MVVDTSAVVAILRREPGWDRFLEAMAAASPCRMSAATWVELSLVVLGKLRPEVVAQVDELIRQLDLELVPFDAVQAALAREGFARYGKGRDPAGLNLGDCFAYALARHLDEPLLFKGDDFARTDIRSALAA